MGIIAALIIGFIAGICAVVSVAYGRFVIDSRRAEQTRRLDKALRTSPAVKLHLDDPEIHVVNDMNGLVRVSGRVHVETIDMDGNVTGTFRVHKTGLVVPMGRGPASAVDVDGVSALDIFTIDGEIDTVNITTTCGLRIGVNTTLSSL